MHRSAAAAALAVLAVTGLQVPLSVPADAGTSLSTRRTQMDTLIDAARKKAGCKPLAISDRLNTSAQRHAKDMATHHFLSHTSSDGTSWTKRIEATGYPYPGGENVSRGRATAGETMKYLLSSPAHKRNITNCALKRVGIGYAASGHYWVQDFGY